VNDFNLCGESSTGTMPKSEHSYYLMQGTPEDDGGRLFSQLIYDKIDTLADKPEEVIMKMNAHEARQQQDVDLGSIEPLALAKTQTKSVKRNSKHSGKSQKSRDSGSESDGSSCSESEKHRRRNWKDTQEFYRCHNVGQIARYCPSTCTGGDRSSDRDSGSGSGDDGDDDIN